jgi:hypothetical protein
MTGSTYLKENRLPEVIAAVTAMGLYRYYKLSFQDWAERIANAPHNGEHWGQLFAEHPEFFRIDLERKKASLVWRRQNPKCFDPQRSISMTKQEVDALSNEEKRSLSRSPLAASEITALISIAVNLHYRALEQSKAKDWWKAIVLSGVLAFVGAIIGAYWGKS